MYGMLFTISHVHNDLARTLRINCPWHTFHPENDEHLRNRTKFTNEWKSSTSKFLYICSENTITLLHTACNVTSDVSCVVIGTPNHVVHVSHVLRSAVYPYMGGAVDGLRSCLLYKRVRLKRLVTWFSFTMFTSTFTTLSVSKITWT